MANDNMREGLYRQRDSKSRRSFEREASASPNVSVQNYQNIRRLSNVPYDPVPDPTTTTTPSAPYIDADSSVDDVDYYWSGISYNQLRFIALVISLHGIGLMLTSALYYSILYNFELEMKRIINDANVWEHLSIVGLVFGTLNTITSLSFVAVVPTFKTHQSYHHNNEPSTHSWRRSLLILYYLTSSVAMTFVSIWLLTTEAHHVQQNKICKAATAVIILTSIQPIVFILFSIWACLSANAAKQDAHFGPWAQFKLLCASVQGMTKSFSILMLVGLTLFLVLWLSMDQVKHDMECPITSKKFHPCTCDALWGEVRCEGSEVSQESINQFFMAFRDANNLSSPNERIQVSSFYVTNTTLDRLDLSYLTGITFTHILSINKNPNLTTFMKFTVNHNNNPNYKIIATSYVDMSENSLDDAGISTIFQQFAPTLKTIYLNGNRIQGSATVEFFPGLSLHKQLEELYLDDNRILKIVGGQFQRNTRLRKLQLSGNRIKEIGPTAFLFDRPEEDMRGQLLSIDLRNNFVTDEKVSSSASLQASSRPTNIYFDSNKFEYISQDNFLTFLETDKTNYLSFHGNKFSCSNKMLWLKERRSDLEARVTGMQCQNDPGKTVFDTDLISGGIKMECGGWSLILIGQILYLIVK